ncbi:hypothetical protein OPT61_g10433 [Boeremia exigua]|uniref:Uncharacterized protein n=1 Tax=Boeremia exigua TaxID=749465 RepID=A0ACC2HQ96_9PLEO|nr:hypothetical protein OPT61_g10433 [Boeremia exigua]
MASFTVRLPRPFADIPRASLLYPYATPIEPLKNLTAHLRSEPNAPRSVPNLWIKHEDTNSALAYGGNKVRKLEYVLADAVAKKATHLVTVGGVQSNSQRQVAAAGNRFGMKTTLTPDPKIGNPSPEDRAAYDSAGNTPKKPTPPPATASPTKSPRAAKWLESKPTAEPPTSSPRAPVCTHWAA